MEHNRPRRPQALQKGDRVAIVAPSSPFNPEHLERGVAWLREQGFEPTWDPALMERWRYLAGSDRERARCLEEALLDPAIQGVFCARGGYGASRLIAHLDVPRVRSHCKVFVGFSDVTTLHLFFRQRCDWVTFHGPVMAGHWVGEGFDPDTASALLACVTGGLPPPIRGGERARTLHGGVARGPLVGGNLSLLCHSLGTAHEPDTDGHILLIEDVHEPPYRIDRMLTHLRQAGKLAGVRGIVVGDWWDCEPPEGSDYTVEDVVAECLGDLQVPVVSGFPISHGKPNLTVPLGIEVELDAERQVLTILEEPTVRGS